VADKKASFLRLAKLEKCEFTVVNEHFENERNEKNGVFLLTLNNKSIVWLHGRPNYTLILNMDILIT
jgi:hypothetical protein